jgi:hypothetical protein
VISIGLAQSDFCTCMWIFIPVLLDARDTIFLDQTARHSL